MYVNNNGAVVVQMNQAMIHTVLAIRINHNNDGQHSACDTLYSNSKCLHDTNIHVTIIIVKHIID